MASSTLALDPNTLVKALRSDRTHHGFTYSLGLNTCPEPFTDREWCAEGGLYACRLKDLLCWIYLYPDIDTVAIVEVPEDAHTKEFANKMKASALVLTHLLPLITAIELAIKHGADVHADNEEALRLASRYGHLDVVKVLVQHGADVHASNDGALRLASEYGHIDVVKFLVEHGANVHANYDGALRWAFYHSHLEVIKVLVQHGADVHAISNQALRHGNLEIFKVLKSLP